MANAPLVGQDGGSRKSDLPDENSEIFFREGLDRLSVICPSCCFVASRYLNSFLRATRLSCRKCSQIDRECIDGRHEKHRIPVVRALDALLAVADPLGGRRAAAIHRPRRRG